MGVVVGLGVGIGLLLVWSAFAMPRHVPRVRRHSTRVRDLLARAGLGHISPSQFSSFPSIYLALMVMIGGARLIEGPLAGGILVAFLARHNPLAIIPVAILLGGIDASGGLIQRRMGLPDATVLVLQGTLFIVILFCETFYGRFKIFNPDLWKRSL